MARPTPDLPPECLDLFEGVCFAHVATLRRDGRLSNNPVGVVWEGGRLRFSTRKKLVKYANLLADPRLALSIPDPANPWRYVEVRGHAEISEDADRAFIDSIARRHMGLDRYPYDLPGDERVIVTVHPEQVSYFHAELDAERGRIGFVKP